MRRTSPEWVGRLRKLVWLSVSRPRKRQRYQIKQSAAVFLVALQRNLDKHHAWSTVNSKAIPENKKQNKHRHRRDDGPSPAAGSGAATAWRTTAPLMAAAGEISRPREAGKNTEPDSRHRMTMSTSRGDLLEDARLCLGGANQAQQIAGELLAHGRQHQPANTHTRTHTQGRPGKAAKCV